MKIKKLIYLLSWRTFGKLFFKCSPYLLFRYRVLILKIFGAKVSWSSRIYPTANIYSPANLTVGKNACISYKTIIYNVNNIIIGNNSCISQYSFLCTASHDYEDIDMRIKSSPITIGKNVWIGADVYIGMGCEIGDKSIVAARSVIFNNVGANEIVSSTSKHYIIKKRI